MLKKLYDDVEIFEYVDQCAKSLEEYFNQFRKIREHNQIKIIRALQEERLSATDFYWTTGYGYDDVGREKVEKIFSNIFQTESALVRPSIASGTHALSLAMSGVLLPGDSILSITGDPYDTLQEVIGIHKKIPCSLSEWGIQYKKVDLDEDGNININEVLQSINDDTRLVMMQRSTGYTFRKALSVSQIAKIATTIKAKYPNIIIMVDNCYGEFTQYHEPSEYNIDLCVGSLIKNPGGSIALCGGYIVGKDKYIKRIAYRLTAPGLGKEVGLTFGTTRNVLQGLYFSPHITYEALRSSILFSYVFQNLGYEVTPTVTDERSDIIVAIKLSDPDKVIEFTRCIQRSCVVDSHVIPYPWDMPGYEDKVIMASGSFIDGSSIELSCDGPLREPYIVYFQGGLSFTQSKLALVEILKSFKKNQWI